MAAPIYRDLKKFCENDGWDPRKKTDHWRYTKTLPDGRTLRAKVSFGSGEIHDPGLFAAILREQLDVSEPEFWRVVREGGPARRTARVAAPASIASGLSASTVLKECSANRAEVAQLVEQWSEEPLSGATLEFPNDFAIDTDIGAAEQWFGCATVPLTKVLHVPWRRARG